MKFQTETKVVFTQKFTIGTYVRLTDTLDMHNGIYIVKSFTSEELTLENQKTGIKLIICSDDKLDRYEFEVGNMKFVPNSTIKGTAKPVMPKEENKDNKKPDEELEKFLKTIGLGDLLESATI